MQMLWGSQNLERVCGSSLKSHFRAAKSMDQVSFQTILRFSDGIFRQIFRHFKRELNPCLHYPIFSHSSEKLLYYLLTYKKRTSHLLSPLQYSTIPLNSLQTEFTPFSKSENFNYSRHGDQNVSAFPTISVLNLLSMLFSTSLQSKFFNLLADLFSNL